MFLVNWFWDVLSYLGLSHKNAKILFLGLDNAGKTTLLHMLKDDKITTHVPTLHPHSEELIIGKIRFKTFDLGGHETARRVWRDYLATVDGIVFMVDAADKGRFIESAEELNSLLDNPELQNVPFVILGNKIDSHLAASEEEMRAAFNLYSHMTYGKEGGRRRDGIRPVEIFMCSVLRKMGYAEAFRWLSQFLELLDMPTHPPSIIKESNILVTPNITENINKYGLMFIRMESDIWNEYEVFLKELYKFAMLPYDEKTRYTTPDGCTGWSQGTEKFNGEFDDLKGSFYFHPLHEEMQCNDFAEGIPHEIPNWFVNRLENGWPSSEMSVSALLVSKVARDICLRVCQAIDNEISSRLYNAIKPSVKQTCRGLFYSNTQHSSNPYWTNWHCDSSILTVLWPSYTMINGVLSKETEAGISIDLPQGNKVFETVKLVIPEGCIGVQVGEAGYIMTKGKLTATAHAVCRSSEIPNRLTLACFFGPNYDTTLTGDFEDYLSEKVPSLENRFVNGDKYDLYMKPVEVCYTDLLNKVNLSSAISEAFGPNKLGVILIRNAPGADVFNKDLWHLSPRLAHSEERHALEDPNSLYNSGWSFAKEKLGRSGLVDDKKGSYYFNPVYEPSLEEASADPLSLPQNKWPTTIENFKEPCQTYGKFCQELAGLIAYQIDALFGLNLYDVLANTVKVKGRLLYYYPATTGCQDTNWIGWHNDSGFLTVLSPDKFYNEETLEMVANPSPETCGLFIAHGEGEEVRIEIPKDAIAVQLGEVLQILTGGKLCATPHTVKSPPCNTKQTKIGRVSCPVFVDSHPGFILKTPNGCISDGSVPHTSHPDVPPLDKRWPGDGCTFGEFLSNSFKYYYS